MNYFQKWSIKAMISKTEAKQAINFKKEKQDENILMRLKKQFRIKTSYNDKNPEKDHLAHGLILDFINNLKQVNKSDYKEKRFQKLSSNHKVGPLAYKSKDSYALLPEYLSKTDQEILDLILKD